MYYIHRRRTKCGSNIHINSNMADRCLTHIHTFVSQLISQIDDQFYFNILFSRIFGGCESKHMPTEQLCIDDARALIPFETEIERCRRAYACIRFRVHFSQRLADFFFLLYHHYECVVLPEKHMRPLITIFLIDILGQSFPLNTGNICE